MRVLVHDYSGHPFPVQLSRHLAHRGHHVAHVYSKSFQSPRGALTKTDDDPDTLDINGISLNSTFHKYSFWKRRFQEIQYGRMLTGEIERFDPDVVLSGNTPLDAQRLLIDWCSANGKPCIFWLQDIYSLAIDRILSKRWPFIGHLIGRYYKWLERDLLKRSAAAVLISPDFRKTVTAWGIDSNKLHVIPNWAPINEIPIQQKANAWSKRHGFDDKFCFIYSGTLGLKHNPALLVQLALEFKGEANVQIVVISEGLGADWLKEQRRALDLKNLAIEAFQPYEELPNILATADVLVAILEPEAGVFSVPSKVLTYLCSGKPLLIAVPKNNLAARIVLQNKAGLVVEPTNMEAFVQAARVLVRDEVARREFGANGLTYARSTFDITAIGGAFESVMADVCGNNV